MRPLRYLNGRTPSPVPAEARHTNLDVAVIRDFVFFIDDGFIDATIASDDVLGLMCNYECCAVWLVVLVA
jgi:hypothetical protein